VALGSFVTGALILLSFPDFSVRMSSSYLTLQLSLERLPSDIEVRHEGYISPQGYVKTRPSAKEWVCIASEVITSNTKRVALVSNSILQQIRDIFTCILRLTREPIKPIQIQCAPRSPIR
jgi:hypothetical protein